MMINGPIYYELTKVCNNKMQILIGKQHLDKCTDFCAIETLIKRVMTAAYIIPIVTPIRNYIFNFYYTTSLPSACYYLYIMSVKC